MLILHLFILLLISCYQNAFLLNSPISATIKNYWYSVGDSVEIYCNSTDETLDDLYFTELESNLPLNETNVNYSVTNVNKNAILLHLYNLTLGKYYYVCQSNKRKRNTFDIGVASFEVGYPPKIKNLSFEYVDLNQLSMFMTPSISHRYWKTTWKFSENSSQNFIYDPCGCFNGSQTCLCEDPFNCTISGEDCFYPNATYEFTILGSNFFGLFNQTYLISPTLEIAKLKNLKRIETFASASSISLSWTWELQDLWPSSAITCEVSYQIPTEEWTKSYLTDGNEMTLKNLLPNTRYLLTLRCKLQGSNYWSDAVQLFEKTSS